MPLRDRFTMFPYWTASFENTGPFPRVSQSCRDGLVELAGILLDIDRAILLELPDAVAECNQGSLIIFGEVTNLYKIPSQSSSPFDFLRFLEDGDYKRTNGLWAMAGNRLLEFQGKSGWWGNANWHQAKSRARVLLDLRSEALDLFEPIEHELIKQGYITLQRDVRRKLVLLDGFERVYNRQPAIKAGEPEREEAIYIRPGHKMAGTRSRGQGEFNRNATLISINFTTTMLCLIPMFLASHHSTPSIGSVQDADFYLLIQNSVMQLLGLFTAIYPIYRHGTGSLWRWAQVFTISGALCSLFSIILYLFAPNIWSAIVSFFGSAAQAGMALLLAMMASSNESDHEKEKQQ